MRVIDCGRAFGAALLLTVSGCGAVSPEDSTPGVANAGGSGAAGRSSGGGSAGSDPASAGKFAGQGGTGAAGSAGASGQSSAGAAAGAASAGMSGAPAADLDCTSAVNIEGDLELPAGGDVKLVANVWGDLTIDPTTKDLSSLRCLQTVGGTLRSQFASGELDALGKLRSVGGDLTIEGNHTIRNLSGLSSLGSIGKSLNIQGNSALLDLSGMNLLGFVGAHLTVDGNSALVSLEGLAGFQRSEVRIVDNARLPTLEGLSKVIQRVIGITISRNPSLRDLRGFEAWTEFQNPVVISSNAALESLVGFGAVPYLNTLVVGDNPKLRDLTGLESVEEVRYLRIYDNTQLQNIDALGTSLTTFGNISLENNQALSSLAGLHQVTSGGSLDLLGDGLGTLNDLRDFEELDGLRLSGTDLKDLTGLGKAVIRTLQIEGNSELQSLAGLSPENLDMEIVRIRENPQLRDLSGLSMVRALSRLEIEANATLASFSGLENLKAVRTITVSDHPDLTSLAALAGLQTITERADFRLNPMLSNCAIQELATRCGAADVFLEQNGACN